MTKEEMATVLKRGLEIREKSWDGTRYSKNCMGACVEASPDNPEMGWLIGLALDGWENDAMDWAEAPHA